MSPEEIKMNRDSIDILAGYVGIESPISEMDKLIEGRKENGFWEDEENIINFARAIMKKHKLDRVPSWNELRRLGYSSLGSAITNNYGGMNRFREAMGEEPIKRKKGEHLSVNQAIEAVKVIMKEHAMDNIPRADVLRRMGQGKLVRDIIHHGGFRKFRGLMGEEGLRKMNGIWKDRNYVVNEVKRIMDENNIDSLPGYKSLCKLGHYSLASSISKYHGGFRNFRESLGEEQVEREKGYWLSIENVIEEAERIMDEYNFDDLPGQVVLNRLGHGSFVAATNRHGGIRKLRERLGQKNKTRGGGVWKSLDFTLEQATKFMEEHELDTLPSGEELRRNGYSSLTHAINSYHGGMNNFRRVLGDKERRKRSEDLNDLNYIINETKKVMEKHNLKILPPGNKLHEMGYGFIVNAVNRHHGGIRKLRERLGQENKRRENGYLKQWENVERELRRIISELDHFPRQKELQAMGMSSLGFAITNHHGGFKEVRRRMGEESDRKDRGFYKDFENIKVEYQRAIRENPELKGEMPSSYWLQKNGYATLALSIGKYHGGFRKFREIMGIDSGQVESGDWKSLDFALEKARDYLGRNNYGELPSVEKMNADGFSSLGAAIRKYHGGMIKFRQLLNQHLGRTSDSGNLEAMLKQYVSGNSSKKE